jgi:hypothetical protein
VTSLPPEHFLITAPTVSIGPQGKPHQPNSSEINVKPSPFIKYYVLVKGQEVIHTGLAWQRASKHGKRSIVDQNDSASDQSAQSPEYYMNAIAKTGGFNSMRMEIDQDFEPTLENSEYSSIGYNERICSDDLHH